MADDSSAGSSAQEAGDTRESRSLLDRLREGRPAVRARRLSDSSATPDAFAPRPLVIRSRDGSRWLPTPDEQTHRERREGQADTTSEPSGTASLPAHDCTSAECAVLKALETTELLESVLCYLDTPDVLSLRRTGRHWDSTVQSSPQLCLHFFTYPQWERPPSRYQLLPLSMPGLTIEEDEPIHLGQWIQVSITPDAARRICPERQQRVRARSIFEGLRGGLGRNTNDAWPARTSTPAITGSLDHEMLQITQPPLLGMQAYVVHRSTTPSSPSSPTTALASVSLLGEAARQREPAAVAKLSCDGGITLGFLAETAQDLLGSLQSEPSSAADVKVVFKAIISFCEVDASPRRRNGGRNLRTVTRIG